MTLISAAGYKLLQITPDNPFTLPFSFPTLPRFTGPQA
jgi:hypothetical protein